MVVARQSLEDLRITKQAIREPLLWIRSLRCFMAPERKMERRKFTRKFKLEAAKLINERGVTIARVSPDLGVNSTMPRRWVKDFTFDPQQAFPGRWRYLPADGLKLN
jgi:hypothetical protein